MVKNGKMHLDNFAAEIVTPSYIFLLLIFLACQHKDTNTVDVIVRLQAKSLLRKTGRGRLLKLHRQNSKLDEPL